MPISSPVRVTFFAIATTVLFASAVAFPQRAFSSEIQSQREQEASGANNKTPDTLTVGEAARTTLTAVQIDDLLQQRPELVVDLKALLADQMQQQGVSVQADSITDEQLFRQIAVSPDVRAAITTWLRSRGYISQADITRTPSDARSQDEARPRLSDPAIDPLSQQLPQSISQQEAAATLLAGSSNRTSMTAVDRRQLASRSVANDARSISPEVKTSNVTDEPDLLRRPAPYNLNSLRDLYTQVPQDVTKLKRFGSDVFTDREGSTSNRSGLGQRDMPIDLPVGPDYVLGSGDSLIISLWGGISQTLQRTIDREGKIVLPEAGSLIVAGLALKQAQLAITNAFKQQFHNAQVDVTIGKLRTVRVYVVGDVQRPGAYDLSSLSTPLNALYSAGGPTSVGSLRTLRHFRGQQLIREIDLYDFLLHGLRMDDERLQSGDTLLIPPAGAQVAIFGAVKRPAIYELQAAETLGALLKDAGGTTVAAALNHITIERIQPNKQRETVTLDQPSGSTTEATLDTITRFKVNDGDRIHIAPILPYSERVIYLEGHVSRPGKIPYRDGMQLSDVVHSYQDLLPEPSAKGDLVRLVPPDLHPETIQFVLADMLIGNTPILLQPFDTIHIYGRYELDSPQVAVRGEVLRPGTYALSRGMTAAQLVRMAGGFKRDALIESADLTSYTIENGAQVKSQRTSIGIGAAMLGNNITADVSLKPGDILTIHQISGWSDIGASVVLNGEVTYPGSYGLQEGEHLSSVLRRAGGFRGTAYPDGAVLVRTQVKELEDKTRQDLIRQIETSSVAARLGTTLSGQDQAALLAAATQQQNEMVQRLRTEPTSGRLVIRVNSNIESWAGTPADIELRSGDSLNVPKRPGFVLVSGQVYNASAITFVPGKTAGWYLQRAGGTNGAANNKEIFVVQANGSVIGRRSGSLFSNLLSTRLEPGDVIVVPQRIIGGSLIWRNLLTVAQITSSIAITAAVAGLF